MEKGKLRKAAGYTAILPPAMALGGRMVLLGLEIRLKKRKSKKHFRQGLLKAGLSERDAERVARGCFSGKN